MTPEDQKTATDIWLKNQDPNRSLIDRVTKTAGDYADLKCQEKEVYIQELSEAVQKMLNTQGIPYLSALEELAKLSNIEFNDKEWVLKP